MCVSPLGHRRGVGGVVVGDPRALLVALVISQVVRRGGLLPARRQPTRRHVRRPDDLDLLHARKLLLAEQLNGRVYRDEKKKTEGRFRDSTSGHASGRGGQVHATLVQSSFSYVCFEYSKLDTMAKEVGPRLRELAPKARGSQDARSRNLGATSLTIPVHMHPPRQRLR